METDDDPEAHRDAQFRRRQRRRSTFPICPGTIGPDVIDIRTLYGKTGKFTYDPGFMSTAACSSAITYIDGDKGELLYRGYPIEQLAQHCDFLEICYLLLNGELPNARAEGRVRTTSSRTTRWSTSRCTFFFRGFRRDAHPMAVMAGLVGALSAFYHDSLDINDPQHREISAIRLIAKMPTLVAMAYKYTIGQPFMYPQERPVVRGELHAHDVRHAVRGVQGRTTCWCARSTASSSCTPTTSRTRRPRRCALRGSSGANPFACIAAGIACLWGPAHGGANEAALTCSRRSATASRRSASSSSKVKDKNSGVKLMGFGHRVYKNYDPRAKLMRETCHEVLDELGLHDDPLFKLAMALEKIALEDEYFVSRKLYPNVDFYSGIVQRALGIPVSLFTASSRWRAPSAGSRSGTR